MPSNEKGNGGNPFGQLKIQFDSVFLGECQEDGSVEQIPLEDPTMEQLLEWGPLKGKVREVEIKPRLPYFEKNESPGSAFCFPEISFEAHFDPLPLFPLIGTRVGPISVHEEKWMPPNSRFIEYGPEDEQWLRYFGLGGIRKVTTTFNDAAVVGCRVEREPVSQQFIVVTDLVALPEEESDG